ncbi:MAG TPA: BON domain-containing protein [Pirellulales bacterium]|nr:BON domain-containing protein [Pirellulales bacterium]
MHRLIVAAAMSAIALLSPAWASAASQNDQQVAQRIRDSLKESGRLSGYSFTVKYQAGTAWLEGRVSSEEQKTLALELTGQMPEVNRVIDRLRVEAQSAGPVVRLLTRQHNPPAGAPQQSEAYESTDSSVLHLVQPGPTSEPLPAMSRPAAPSDDEVRTASGELVFPESLDAPETPEVVVPEFTSPVVSAPTVRPAASQRSVLRRLKPPVSEPSPMNEVVVAPARRVTSTVIPAAESRPVIAPIATRNSVHRQTAQRARQPVALQNPRPAAQVGQIRLVPMMQLADGRLVPVADGQSYAPAGATPLGQPVAAKSKPTSRRRMFGKRSSSQHKTVSHAAQIEPGLVEPLPAEAVPAVPAPGGPLPAYVPGVATGIAPAYYDQPHMPNYAWPSYASYPNYAGLTYPKQYSPTAWPYIGPFYPYPQVPLGWRKVTLEWDDGWWFLDFDDTNRSYAY